MAYGLLLIRPMPPIHSASREAVTVHTIKPVSVSANGIAHHLLTAGPESGPAVLLIHGLGWDSTLWTGQIEALAAAGWRVLAPDLRGMGATEKPEKPYAIDGYQRDMSALLTAMGVEQAAVVGFSLGGMIAMALAAAEPQRVGAAVFACCNAQASAEARASTEAMLDRAASLGPVRFAEEQAEAIWRDAWARVNPHAVQDFIAWRAAMDQAALTRAFRAAFGVDLRPALPGITVPTRVIVADEDRFLTVETGRTISEHLPRGDLVIIEQSGHMAPVEQPAAFNEALFSFLEAHWPPASDAAA